jgi:hypothetical protein
VAGGQWPAMDARPTCGGSHVVEESGIVVPTLSVANWRGKPATSGGYISGAFSIACGKTSVFGGLTRKAADQTPAGIRKAVVGIKGVHPRKTALRLRSGQVYVGHRATAFCLRVPAHAAQTRVVPLPVDEGSGRCIQSRPSDHRTSQCTRRRSCREVPHSCACTAGQVD